MNPSDLIGTLVFTASVILTVVAVIWLPILRRRELAQIAEQKSRPIFIEVRGSTQFNADGSARSEAINDLSPATELILKRKPIPGSDEGETEVYTMGGQSLGVLPAVPGRELAKEIAADKIIDVKIDLLSGGTDKQPDYYIKLVLKRRTPQTGRRR
jgi:hypothetical protein